MKKHLLLLGIILSLLQNVNAQGYLHADGIKIVNGSGENVILRGIGTGNWMLMEGYMMKTAGVAGTQHEFRAKLNEIIGKEKTNEFFDTWLANHFTRTDVDSMKAWGFNSIRAAMHYKWFTLPIEEEPVAGENTFLDKGFVMIDSLLDWCRDNEMYLILDMHGTPGGQGKNADICDYDYTKPSLWESTENQDKLTALWFELAKRYANEPWIGGYDLINETNWDFENSGNENGVNCVLNIPLLEMHKRLIDTIRTIDNNHLVFVSGNSWGNNYSGMDELGSYDNNLGYTFHKYWSGNDENSVDWITAKRDALNVPLWMSESGENSNTWYTDAIHIFEANNIGWSWWPVKKGGINNVMDVTFNSDYENLIKYWRGEASKPTEEAAFNAVMTLAENHKIENCKVKYDVIDAMMRQPYTDEVIPYNNHKFGEPIFFSEYDYGKLGIAYNDTYYGNYGGDWTGWNNGWGLRNDGVDIEACNDADTSNGYNVGWTDDNEWLQYTLKSDSVAAYTLKIRHASGGSGAKVHFEANGVNISNTLDLPGTGDWQNWETTTFQNIIIPAGEIKLKFVLDKGGSNLNYFSLTSPKPTTDVDFVCTAAKTSDDGSMIYIDLNKPVTVNNEDIDINEFTLNIDGETNLITAAYKQVSPSTVLVLEHDANLYSGNIITLSFAGSSVKSDNKELIDFSDFPVINNLPYSHEIPGKIQAEDFIINEGLGLEDCKDSGAGLNTGWANAGDYLVYRVHVNESSWYKVDYRVATARSNAKLEMLLSADGGATYNSVNTIDFTSTGDWQNWETQSTKVELNEGHYLLKLLVKQSEHNLNWFKLSTTTPDAINTNKQFNFTIYPNPAKEHVTISSKNEIGNVNVFDITGKLYYSENVTESFTKVNTSAFKKGVYFVQITNAGGLQTKKLIIQ